MKKISIFSEDKRFLYTRELLQRDGYECSIMDIDRVPYADALILPVGRMGDKGVAEHALRTIGESTTVFTGDKEKVGRLFSGRIIDYSENEAFQLKNAYITALCAIRLTLERSDSVILGKRALVLGYGRIGKYLSSMLRGLGADVFVYARKESARQEAQLAGCRVAAVSDISELCLDMVYNTVPQIIVDRQMSGAISKNALVMELASAPGGFENGDIALKAPALPGRMMPRSAGEAVYDLVSSVLSKGDML